MQHPLPPHPYRVAGEPAIDEEAAALAWLVAKARRVRRAVGFPILGVALLAAAAGYMLFRHVLFSAIDMRAPYITILLTALPIFVLGQALAAFAGRKAVLARSKAWIDEVTVCPAVSPALLEAFVRLL
jgi:hypothetical protein